MSGSLVRTKLLPPHSGNRTIARESLLDLLLRARRRRCLAIQGPGGCGKTTTLIAWRQALVPLGYEVAWLTLSADDNEPARFLDYLLASVAEVDPRIVNEAAQLVGRGVDDEIIERIVIALVRGVAAFRQDLVLMLDDIHHLQEPRIHQALQLLLDYAPDNLHLVVSSRSAMPMSLARLRAHGQTLEVDLRDLRFSLAETEQFLRARIGSITARDAQRLHELCDGWVAGLQLLSLDLKQVPVSRAQLTQRMRVLDPGGFAQYFDQEVLSHLSERELRCLTHISVCNRFCMPVCAVLLRQIDPHAEAADAAGLIARLELENLFIAPVSTSGREVWYRLHPLLREVLLARFARLSDEERRAVHASAAAWFKTHALIDEAVRHTVQAEDFEHAALLVEQCAPDLFVQGELRTLASLLHRLPKDQAERRPALLAWMARLKIFAREFDNCRKLIAQLQATTSACDRDARFRIAILQCSLALQCDDTDAARAVLPDLLDPPPSADALAIGARNNLLPWIFMHGGEFERARRVHVEQPPPLIDGVPLLGTSCGLLGARCMVGLSHALQGQVGEAERVYRDVLHEAKSRGGACFDPACLATALLAEVLYERNEVDAARDLVENHLDVLDRVSIPDSVLRMLLALARVHWHAGRRMEAMGCIERLEDYGQQFSLDRLLAYSLTEQVGWQLQRFEFRAAQVLLERLDALAACHATVSAGSALGEIGLVTQCAHVRMALAKGELEAAGGRLPLLIARCEAEGRMREVASLQMQLAVIEQRCGRGVAARELALTALMRGHRLGLVRSMLDAASGVLELLSDVLRGGLVDPVLAFYVERLQAAAVVTPAADTIAAAPSRLLLDSLTEREAEVVCLLAQAMPNKKIARALGLSPETVKWHLKNVYGKLGVTGRDEAVARVRDLGLSFAA